MRRVVWIGYVIVFAGLALGEWGRARTDRRTFVLWCALYAAAAVLCTMAARGVTFRA